MGPLFWLVTILALSWRRLLAWSCVWLGIQSMCLFFSATVFQAYEDSFHSFAESLQAQLFFLM